MSDRFFYVVRMVSTSTGGRRVLIRESLDNRPSPMWNPVKESRPTPEEAVAVWLEWAEGEASIRREFLESLELDIAKAKAGELPRSWKDDNAATEPATELAR